MVFCCFNQKTAYEIVVLLEFQRVLFRSQAEDGIRDYRVTGGQTCALPIDRKSTRLNFSHTIISYAVSLDRKSTRLNSSHTIISYAVFCLKKKRRSHYHLHIGHDRASEGCGARLRELLGGRDWRGA